MKTRSITAAAIVIAATTAAPAAWGQVPQVGICTEVYIVEDESSGVPPEPTTSLGVLIQVLEDLGCMTPTPTSQQGDQRVEYVLHYGESTEQETVPEQ